VGRSIHKLSDRKCKTAKPGRHSDGGGLYLVVTGPDARSWSFFYKIAGKRREMGLGSYRDVPLGRARELATLARVDRTAGLDPKVARDARRGSAVTFGQAGDKLLESLEPGWTNLKHRQQWRHALTVYAAALRPIPVDRINTEVVLETLRPLWLSRPESAARLCIRVERVLDWARAHGHRSGENPARWRGHLRGLLPRRIQARRHHPAMAFDELPAFMTALRGVDSLGARALQVTILTACRTSEVLGARWSEVNFDGRMWTIPAHRMKSRREHRVPLSGQALVVLRELHELRQSDFVFPGRTRSRPAAHVIMLRVLQQLGHKGITVHGFRSSFRDWAAERSNFPREVVEMALAHAVGDATERAYARSDLLERRRKLMDAWSNFCSKPLVTGAVVPLQR
jgi:integrase